MTNVSIQDDPIAFLDTFKSFCNCKFERSVHLAFETTEDTLHEIVSHSVPGRLIYGSANLIYVELDVPRREAMSA